MKENVYKVFSEEKLTSKIYKEHVPFNNKTVTIIKSLMV